jgi:hypothetical protein
MGRWTVACHALTRRARVEGEVVRRETSEHFRSLSTSELENDITGMLTTIEGGLGRVNAVMRERLIVALEVYKNRIPHGQWEQFLRANKLHPATVRSWRARGRHDAQRLREILGDEVVVRPPRRKKPEDESASVQLAKAGQRLAMAVLRKDWKYAIRLARDLLEAFEHAA